MSLFLFLDNDSCQFCGCVNSQDIRAQTDRDGVSGSLRLCITNILLCIYAPSGGFRPCDLEPPGDHVIYQRGREMIKRIGK